MERIEDQQLLERFFSGEDESFEVIVSEYESRVFHTALYLTETSEDAEMVLQEVFLELHAKLLSDMGKTPLFDWLLQRTLDISVDRLINKKQEIVELPEHATTYRSMSEHVTSFTDRHENFCTSLQRATRNLPETLKFVFLLRDIQGLSLSRVSSILGINVFEARNRLHQARLRIHSELAQLTEYEVRRVSESR